MHASGFGIRSRSAKNALWIGLSAALVITQTTLAGDAIATHAWADERLARGRDMADVRTLFQQTDTACDRRARPWRAIASSGVDPNALNIARQCQLSLRPHVPAGALPVTSCADDGTSGTLRAVVAAAVSGDTIDLTQLTCSGVTLATGAIAVTVDDLTLVGSGSAAFAIYAGYADRGLEHTGAGTLTIDALAVVDGRRYVTTYPDDAKGGCIYSSGSVRLVDAGVVNCYATNTRTDGGVAAGGGIYAKSTVTLEHSYITEGAASGYLARGGASSATHFVASDSYIGGYPFGNVIYSTGWIGNFHRVPGGGGGGVYVGSVAITNSIFIGNSTQRFGQRGGALMLTYGQSTITGSVFFENQAGGYGGAIFMPTRLLIGGYYQYCGYSSLAISDSTFTGNVATTGAGMYAGCTLDLANTTIAYNSAIGFVNGRGGGAMIGGYTVMNSTIIAGNLSVGVHPDLDSVGFIGPLGFDGHANLIDRPNIGVPRDTIIDTTPQLGQLALNGGTWPTLALLPGSPAIDAGNNVHNLPFDERGDGYPRVSGFRADIGAYELQQSRHADVLFEGRFE